MINKLIYSKFLFLILVLFIQKGHAQTGLNFLNIPQNATQNALGGTNISFQENANSFTQNPSLLDSTQINNLGISYSPYFVQSNYYSINYVYQSQKKRIFGLNIQHLNSGKFDGTDDLGNYTSTFGAGDVSVAMTTAQKINNITFGITVKGMTSVLESTYLMAFLTDWGGIFKHPKKDLTIGIVAKNMGIIYAKNAYDKPKTPFDLQLGVTFKPQFMPVRFSLTGTQLYKFDLLSDLLTTYKYDNNGNKVKETPSFTNNLFSHCIFGAEFLFHKNIHALVGFDYFQMKTMKVAQISSFSGLSYGVRASFKKFGFALSQKSIFTGKKQTMFTLDWRII